MDSSKVQYRLTCPSQVAVQVSADGHNVSRVLPYIPGAIVSSDLPQLPYPIKLSAMSRNNYFIPRETFSILTMFGNPMMLMMGVGAVLIFAVPYLAVSSSVFCVTT